MSPREFSLWTYPWDLQDVGLDRALGHLREAGANTVSLATSYHAGRFLQPANPRRRVYFPEDGTVYYSPDPALWTGHEITPKPAAIVSEGDMLSALIRAREAGGPAVSCWTVCLHNTRLGMVHPGHVVRTAHGDPLHYALCPSSPAAREYVTTMVGEITRRYRPDRVELESPNFLGIAHGYHHEKDGVGLLPEDEFLLSLCFCDHCIARATSAGVDAKAAREAARSHLDVAFARELPARQWPDFPERRLDAFADHDSLRAYLDWRREPVTSLIAACRDAADPASRVLLIDVDDAWMGGVDPAAAARACDGVVLCAYTTPADEIGAVVARRREAIGSERTLIVGLQVFHPEVADAQDLAARATAAAPHVDGINFYNYGLIPPGRRAWVRRAVDSVSG